MRCSRSSSNGVVDQLDIGNPGLWIDQQFLRGESSAEEAVARGLVLDQPLGVFIMTVIEHGTGTQGIAFRNNVAQVHRLTRIDLDDQARGLAALDLAVDTWLIVAKGLGRFLRLLLGPPAEAFECTLAAIAEAADIAFHIGLQLIVGRVDPNIEFTLRQRHRTA